ncbi:MAG: hypothetical protein IPO09_02020 [Anaeromyxobacter sp.]|nr:hypothetical protein [Anaeromyxobacter sp.]
MTPIAGSGGRTARIEVSPDAAGTGLVSVAGKFEATVTAAGGTSVVGGANPCAATAALVAPVNLINKAPETLRNVQIQITDMALTGRESCNSDGVLSSVGAPADVTPGATFGAWNYGNLLGTAVAVNGVGSSLSKNWWMKFPDNTPVRFHFVVWADAGQAELNAAGAELEVGQPLSWSSITSPVTQLEVCATDPMLNNGNCPGPTKTLVAASNPLGPVPYLFSAVPATVAGTTYYWRVFNAIGAGQVPGWYPSPWDSFTAMPPLGAPAPVITAPAPGTVVPADILANAVPLLLTWDTSLTVASSVFQICTGPCPVPFALVDPNLANLVYENIEPGFFLTPGVTSYEVDLSTLLPTDPATLDAWLLPAAYTVAVHNFDDLTAVTFGAAATTNFTVAPAAAPSPVVVGPPDLATIPANDVVAGFPVVLEWTTDQTITSSEWFLCSSAPCPGVGGLNVLSQGVLAGVPGATGDPFSYAVDVSLAIPTDPATADLWLLPGTYVWTISNVVAGLAVGVPTTASFIVVDAMPPAPVVPGAVTAPANAFTSAIPVALSWTAPAGVTATELVICSTIVCDALTADILPPTAVPPTVPGGTSYTYDPAATPDLLQDFVLLSNGGYLAPGTYYWVVYNLDPLTGVALGAGTLSTVTVTAVPVGPAAFALKDPAAAPVTNLSRLAGPIPLSWTGPPQLLATTVEFYDDAAATLFAGVAIVADDLTLQPANSHFVLADARTALTLDQPYFWRVVDDGLAAYYAGVPDLAAWSAIGTFTIVP